MEEERGPQTCLVHGSFLTPSAGPQLSLKAETRGSSSCLGLLASESFIVTGVTWKPLSDEERVETKSVACRNRHEHMKIAPMAKACLAFSRPIILSQCWRKKGFLGEMRHRWLFSLASLCLTVLFIIYLESLPQSPRGGILSPFLEVVVSQEMRVHGKISHCSLGVGVMALHNLQSTCRPWLLIADQFFICPFLTSQQSFLFYKSCLYIKVLT
jgi:hypothetical protein